MDSVMLGNIALDVLIHAGYELSVAPDRISVNDTDFAAKRVRNMDLLIFFMECYCIDLVSDDQRVNVRNSIGSAPSLVNKTCCSAGTGWSPFIKPWVKDIYVGIVVPESDNRRCQEKPPDPPTYDSDLSYAVQQIYPTTQTVESFAF